MTADLRIRAGVGRSRAVRFVFDGKPIDAYEGESIAAALLAAGVRRLGPGLAAPDGSIGPPAALFCAIGRCQRCIVRIDGLRVEACRTVVRDGAVVEPAA